MIAASPGIRGSREPRSASLYVHFPYCLTKCPYCDFVSYKTAREAIDHIGYADAVIAELKARARYVAHAWSEQDEPRRIESVFFGGGTPSLWEPHELGRVLAAARESFTCSEALEVTVECNPTSLDEERARALKAVGVNRLSVGTQSLRAEQLQYLGRLHDPAGAQAAVRSALASGVGRVSTDLIFGLPGQSPEDARAQAGELADVGLRHLSCYQLTIEPGTQFGELSRRGRLPLADDGLVAEGFLAIDAELSSRGFSHYEISNYAMPGEESRHNLAYWRGLEYVGVGCGAYGYVRSVRDRIANRALGVRYRNAIDPQGYLAASSGVRDDILGVGDGLSISSEPLDGETLLRERIMLGLRLAAGVDLAECARDLGVEAWTRERLHTVDALSSRGRVVREGDSLRIPRAAWLWTDDTAARLF
jgi:putative oxygen-independent coproporphyrinogen III oxidase